MIGRYYNVAEIVGLSLLALVLLAVIVGTGYMVVTDVQDCGPSMSYVAGKCVGFTDR